MSDDALLPPVSLINLSPYRLSDLLKRHGDGVLDAAIRRVTTDAEGKDAVKISAFNSGI